MTKLKDVNTLDSVQLSVGHLQSKTKRTDKGQSHSNVGKSPKNGSLIGERESSKTIKTIQNGVHSEPVSRSDMAVHVSPTVHSHMNTGAATSQRDDGSVSVHTGTCSNAASSIDAAEHDTIVLTKKNTTKQTCVIGRESNVSGHSHSS